MNTQRRPTSYVTLDLTLPDVQTSLAVTQGDTTRRIVATIQDGGRPFELPRKWTAMLTGTKPDGKFLYNSCVIDYSGRIVYDFASGTEIATAIGDYAVTFEIYDEAGDKVSSPSLWLSVKPDKTRDHASNDQFTAAQEILGRLNKVEDGLDFLEGDQDSEYLAYEGASLIRVNKEAPSGYDALKVSSAVDGLHIVKFDSTLYEVATNELAGYWVEINGKRAYVGSNTVDSLTLYTDHTKTRPRAFFASAGTLIHILGDDVTDAMLGVIGAAPAGFGLGGECVEVLDWNTAIKNGFYSDTNGEERKHSPFLGMAAWGYTVAMKNDDAITQVAFTYAKPNWNHALVQKIRHLKGAEGWREWEWVNPPMEVGIEYRTTERWMGKHVYTRLIDFEALPNNSEKSATFYMDSKYTIVSIDGVVRGEGLDEYGMVKEFDIHACPYVEDVAVLQLNNKITIKTNGDATKYNAKIVLKYTK